MTKDALLNSGPPPEIKRHGGRRPGAGRPPKRGLSRERIATATGMSPRTQRRVEEHVRLVETYGLPRGWSRSAVLRFGAVLEKLPVEKRREAVALALGGGTRAW